MKVQLKLTDLSFLKALLFIGLYSSCSLPEGLTQVEGVDGEIIIDKSLLQVDSIQAVIIVALDQLETEHSEEHIVSYSDLFYSDTLSQNTSYFFIQLPVGGYRLVPVGIVMNPSEFIANLETILQNTTNIPVIFPILEDIEDINAKTISVLIHKDEITHISEPWIISSSLFDEM